MSRVAQALSVSRSHLYEQKCGSPRQRGAYTKTDDATLLPLILDMVASHPTYGYRAIA